MQIWPFLSLALIFSVYSHPRAFKIHFSPIATIKVLLHWAPSGLSRLLSGPFSSPNLGFSVSVLGSLSLVHTLSGKPFLHHHPLFSPEQTCWSFTKPGPHHPLPLALNLPPSGFRFPSPLPPISVTLPPAYWLHQNHLESLLKHKSWDYSQSFCFRRKWRHLHSTSSQVRLMLLVQEIDLKS